MIILGFDLFIQGVPKVNGHTQIIDRKFNFE